MSGRLLALLHGSFPSSSITPASLPIHKTLRIDILARRWSMRPVRRVATGSNDGKGR